MMNKWNETLSALPPEAATPSALCSAMAMMATAAASVTGTADAVQAAGADAAGAPAAASVGPGAAPAEGVRTYADFGHTLTTAQLADGFVAPVGNLGLIAVTGADAASFLQGQLTNDVATLTAGMVRLAGYCTPKGRLQATMTLWRAGADDPVAPDAIYLQVPLAMQAAFQKRLSMFVMRAKAKLVDVTGAAPHAAVLGLGGTRAGEALRMHAGTLPAAPNTVVTSASGTVLRLADAFGAPRYLWLTSADAASAALPTLQATLALGGTDAWELSGIHAGIAQVTSATFEQFVPQMINLELVGGVSFKKGCYPGQEIVARSQYLGKLKRRTALATIADPAAAAGAELFSVEDPAQPCGMIVNAAPNGAGGVDALVEIKLAALDQAVHLGSTTGARVEFLTMPYALDALDL
jgi:folate-binding protein YgfZ